VSSSTCGNCDAPLTGPYCAQCGQHARENARALRLVLHDGLHLLTHLDERLWLTLRTLLSRPGQLTADYFADRRSRYFSPLQLYLALSIVFFALTAANTNLVSASAAPDQSSAQSLDASDCDKIVLRWPWPQARLRAACKRQIADNGRSAAHAFGAYIPKMMFVFLPLMALVMVPLYRSTRRYYVEHLVFFLHLHAALFLVMAGDLLLSMMADRLAWLNRVSSIGDVAAASYAVWFVYRALRRYYGEGRVPTLAKLAVIGIAYQIFLVILVAATLLLSALTA
jgi:hypothetical protein